MKKKENKKDNSYRIITLDGGNDKTKSQKFRTNKVTAETTKQL